MKIPPYLKPGDTVAIAAPARKISEEEIQPAVQLLRKEGFSVYYDERLFAQCHQFAGDDETRAGYIQELLDNPSIKAVWFARGGYGSARIIDRLDFSIFQQNPKWLVGYSDVTVFHAHVHRLNIATLHATMPVNVHNEELGSEANRSLLDALRGKSLRYEIPAHPLTRAGEFSAPVIGGNLSILYSLMGTPSEPNTDGKVLFVEDLDEYLYHIDRMMTSLDRGGKLKHLAGLLVGHLSDMHDNTIPYGKTAEEIVFEHCQPYHYPIIFNFPAGHENLNLPVKMGCTLNCHTTNQSITIEF